MKDAASISRRQFVRIFTLSAAFSVLMGKPWRASLLAEVHPLAPNTKGLLQVRLSEYPALQDDFGSVRLGFSPLEGDPPLPTGLFYPIIISRAPGHVFHAVNSSCRHAGCVTLAYDVFEGAIVCPCHGSRYDIDGQVAAGPATSSLSRYPVTFDGVDTVAVEVPGLGYRLDVSRVESETPRLQLDFPTMAVVEYEVLFRARLEDEWMPVPFALTPEGPADQMSLFGNDEPASVFVDRPPASGFYSVAIKILDLTP